VGSSATPILPCQSAVTEVTPNNAMAAPFVMRCCSEAIKQLTLNQRIEGSSPPAPTNISSILRVSQSK
jgi:hypothetical protein